MVTISLCMIVKDEEKFLGRCLDSIKDAVDEIVIVDTGSKDATREVAAQYTDKVYDFEWIQDFAAARNFAFSKATMDYQMWLDADDVVEERQLTKILELKNTLSLDVDMVTMKYITAFDKNDKPLFSSTRERLLKRENDFKWQDPVHECIPLQGNIFKSDIYISHRKEGAKEGQSHRNLNIYKALEDKVGAEGMTPRQQYYFARELKDHGQWAKATLYFEMFLDGGRGWVEDNIAACYALSICYQKLKDEAKVLPILIKSFTFAPPRADICSHIGYFYKRLRDFEKAFRWFKIAADTGCQSSLGFVAEGYCGFIPCIECCVCLCHMGDFEKAKEYNERAADFKPTSEAVMINREYLKSLL